MCNSPFCCCFVGEGFVSPGALAAVERYTGDMNVSPYKPFGYSILSKSGIKISMF